MVDLREVRDAAAGRAEVAAKYVVKPRTLSAPAVRDWMDTMRRIRRFRWFGTWEGVQLPDDYQPRVIMASSQLYGIADGGGWMQVEALGGRHELESIVTMAAGDLPPESGITPEQQAAAAALQPTWGERAPPKGKRGHLAVVVSDAWARRAYQAVNAQASDPATDRAPPTVDVPF